MAEKTLVRLIAGDTVEERYVENLSLASREYIELPDGRREVYHWNGGRDPYGVPIFELAGIEESNLR